MTTFEYHGRSFEKVIALVATAALWGSAAQAKAQASIHAPPTPMLHRGNLNCIRPDPASRNRYVLLLFFQNTDDVTSAVKNLFMIPDQSDDLVPSGCVNDPDYTDGKHGIVVQGACPTDCVHPPLEALANFKLGKYTPGDPLSHVPLKQGDPLNPLNKKPGWGLFFADRDGKAEAGSKDKDTPFTVWQIVAKDSCHAGKVLSSLLQNTTVFSASGGYMGEIMIGYKVPALHAHGPGSPKDCAVWSQ